MNKTVTINIAGLVFHIDENAYHKLDSYINAVKNSIQQDGEEEIIADIESRIAELFAERIDPHSGVILMNNVDEIINIMGKPEDYMIEEEPVRTMHYSANTEPYDEMYRDGEKRVVGGVCSGLGHYVNIDPVWIRIIFILLVLLYGTSLLVYFILWIVIPKANTVSEVLEMKGEPVNISNIEKQFRQSVSTSYQTIRNNGKSAAEVIRKVFGIILITFSVISIFGSFFAPIAFNAQKDFIFGNLITYNEAAIGIPFWILNLSLFLVSCLPFLVLLLCGIKLLNPKLKHIGLTSAILGFIWLVVLFIFAYVMINVNLKKDKIEELFKERYETTVSKSDLTIAPTDTLKVIFQRDPRIYTVNDSVSDKLRYSEIDDIDVKFYQSNTENAYIEIEEKIFNNKFIRNTTSGSSDISVNTSKFSNTLNYNYLIKSDTLVLSNSLLATKNNFTDDNKVKVKVYVMPNQKIKLNGNDKDFISNDIDQGIHYYKFNQHGKLTNTNDIIN